MQYEYCNFKVEDYTNVVFCQHEMEVTEQEFDEAIKDIKEFKNKVKQIWKI